MGPARLATANKDGHSLPDLGPSHFGLTSQPTLLHHESWSSSGVQFAMQPLTDGADSQGARWLYSMKRSL